MAEDKRHDPRRLPTGERLPWPAAAVRGRPAQLGQFDPKALDLGTANAEPARLPAADVAGHAILPVEAAGRGELELVRRLPSVW